MPDNDENKGEEMVKIPVSVLAKMQEQMAEFEQKLEENKLRNEGLAEMFEKADTTAEPALREKKDFTPKFRTIRLRRYPIAGKVDNLGIVSGWTNRGAYKEIDASGLTRQEVDYIEIMFFGQDRTPDGKVKAEKVRLLDLINNSVQVTCKIVDEKKRTETVPTGEEIGVSVFDPKHGLVDTGDKIDGFYTVSDIQYKVQIPGVGEEWIDSKFCNQ